MTATVKIVTIASGAWASDDAVGYLSITGNTGTWTNNEEIHVLGAKRALVNGSSEPSTQTLASAYGTQYAQTIEPNGAYDFVNFNFQGEEGTETMYGVNGVDNAFEFDGTNFTKIRTGLETDEPNHIEAYKNHLFVSYENGSLVCSGLQLPTVFSTTMGSTEIIIGDAITGMSVESKDALAVFGRNNIYILYGKNKDDFNLTMFYTGSGAVNSTVEKMQTTIFLVGS